MTEPQPAVAGTLPSTSAAVDAQPSTSKTASEPPAEPDKPSKRLGRLGGDAFAAFLPNRVLSPTAMHIMAVIQIIAALGLWSLSRYEVLPRPAEVLTALPKLWVEQGLGQDLWTSFKLTVVALFWTAVISLGLSYLSVLPFFRPIAAAISKGRFLSLLGFSVIFTVSMGGGYMLQLTLLVLGMTVFFVTSMASVVANIPRADFDYARTLRMSEWRVVWEVVILGTIAEAFEVLRQNMAIGWTLLTLVEGLVRSSGGVGTALLNQQKLFHLPELFAIQLLILLLGLFLDYVIGLLRSVICPYADLTLERRGR
ncbi:MAG: nitrate ABC transporter permease [Armatimonadota bacterium]